VLEPFDFDCINGSSSSEWDQYQYDTITINFELAEHRNSDGNGDRGTTRNSDGTAVFPAPQEFIEKCVILLVPGLRNTTKCLEYQHGVVNRIDV
jgi:hypothetical protein